MQFEISPNSTVIPRLVRGTSSTLSTGKQRSPGSLLRIDRGMTDGSCRRAVGRLTPCWHQPPSHICHPRRMSGAGRTHGGDPCGCHQLGPGLAPGLLRASTRDDKGVAPARPECPAFSRSALPTRNPARGPVFQIRAKFVTTAIKQGAPPIVLCHDTSDIPPGGVRSRG